MKIIKKIKAFFCIYLIFYSSIAHGQNPNALPTNPNITNGSAVISQSGSSLTINQSTEKLITNWSTFNIGSNASVEFVQPSSSSSALNRVSSNDPTHIYGNLKANGKIILMNPSGVLFHNGSRVDVGALIATSLNMQDGDFLNNQYIFEKDGLAGTVNNSGTINAFKGGAVALLSDQVTNDGTINTPDGTTALLSGEKITLTLNGNRLIQYTIDRGTLNSLVENKQAINAGDGIIILSAKGLSDVSQSVVKNTGTLKAESISKQGGKIYLSAREGEVVNSGTISTNSTEDQGGNIEITGDEITIETNSKLTATGKTGGGQILVGGSWQNSDSSVYQSTVTTVETDTLIDASATLNGDGGEIVIWSDITNNNSITTVNGTLYGKGGSQGGDGGRIETSGYKLITTGVSGSASALKGQSGLWLFDPTNITIGTDVSYADAATTNNGSNIKASTINNLLNGGTNVTITTHSVDADLGDLTVDTAIEKSSGANDVTLILKAANSIILNQSITHTGGAGKLNIQLDSDNDSAAGASASRDGAGIIIVENNISSGGGDITFGGDLNNSLYGGDLYVGGGSTAVSIDSSGGDIHIKGQLIVANSSASGLTLTSSNGAITIGGAIDSGNSYTGVTSTLTWEGAKNAADDVANSYLATITSSLENSLAIRAANYGTAWLGGRRKPDTNLWQWVTDPNYDASTNPLTFFYQGVDGQNEVGTSSSGRGGTAATGYFANWNGWGGDGSLTGEPNNWTGSAAGNFGDQNESGLQFTGSKGLWNDLPENSTTLTKYVRETELASSKLTINAGTGDVTLSGAVGSNKVLSDFTITGAQVTGSSVALNNSTDLNITNSGTSSLTGVISGTSVDLIKNGSGVLTLSGNNTYTGSTTVSNGTLAISSNNALGTSAAGTTVASGATLDIQNTTYSTAEAITLNGGTIATSTGTSTFAGAVSLGADSIIDIDGTKLTLSGVISDGVNNFAIDKTGTGNLVLSGTNTFSGDTTVSAGTLTLTGALSSSTDLIVNSSSTFDLQASQTFASLDLDGTISNSTGTSSLIVSGTSDIGGNITTSGIQTYTGAVTLSANSTLTTTNSQITFSNTLNSDSTTRNLTASVGTSEVQFDGIVGGTNSLGAIAITGALDLNAAISSASSLSVSTTSNLGANVTTSGTQTYTGEADLSSDIIFTTSNSNVTFSDNIILSSASQSLTISAGTGNVSFGGSVGGLFVEDEAGTIGTQTVLTSSNWKSTVDTTGIFSHSVDLAGSNDLTIGDITFVASDGDADDNGFTDSSPHTVGDVEIYAAREVNGGGWDVADLGSDSDSNNLETLFSSIKWNSDDNDDVGGGYADDLAIEFSNLTAGKVYKLQMFFGEDSNSDRGFDIDFENGSNARAEIRADYDTNPNSNSDANPQIASFIDYTFQAEGTTANLILDGDGWGGVDKNPIISGVSLEEISEISSNALSSLTVTSGSFSTSGNIYSNGAVTLNNSSDTTINNLIRDGSGGSASLVKGGSAVLTLGGDNDYTGSTTINAGTLKITDAAGLGTTASGTTVASGATLEVSGGLTVAETLSLSGTGASSNGALRFTSGNNTYSGNITLGANSAVNATAGDNIISGTVNGAYNFVVVSTAGSFTQSGIAGGSTALTAYEVNSSTYNTTISAAVTTNGNINIEAGSIDITADLTATSGNIVLDADTGSAINSGDDGINIGDITIRTNTSGNITLTGRSGSGNVADLMGVQASGGSTTINSAGNLSVTGISESTNTSATRGIWLRGDYDATGDITLAGQAKSSTNDYDVSVEDSTFDAGGNITFDAQNGGRINFAGTNTLTATGNHVYKGDNFVPNSATFNGSGSFSLTPDTDSMAFSTGIDISSASFGTSLTDFTVGVSTNNENVTLGDIDVDGEINVFGGDITLTASNTLTAGSNENIVLSAESNFVNNSGSSALNVSGTGRWIVYAADDDNSTFGNLNSNNAPIWNQQYSSLAPASVSSGNRYVFQESSPSQNITFTTTDETITYGDSVDLSDNYSITSSGVSGLANVYAAVPSGGSVSISDAFSANPTITSAGTSAGSHNIRVASGDEGTANSGYSISYANSGTLTVNRRAITVTADDQSKQYGNANPSLTQTITTGSLVGSDTLSGSVTTAAATGSNVGSYSITQGTLTNANNSNYDITFVNGSLTVSRRDITLTADDKTKTYGDNNPSLTYTVSTGSLYSSDTLSGSITTSATASTGAGSVSITQGTLTNANNSNYDITFNSGTLTINRKALSITGDNQSRTYGASNPSLTYTLTSGSLVGSDSLSGTLATTATTSTNVGNVNITQGTLTNANNTNYSISYSTGTLSITKASPTISGLSNQSKTTDDSSFTLAGTPSISGPSISYTSSDTDVATVNSSTGEVSILATGTSTITASFTGNSNWNAGSGTYLLTVTEPTISSSSSSTQVADNAAQDVTTAVRQNVRRNSNVVLPGSNTNTFTRPTLISYGNVRAPSPSVSPITTTPSTSVVPPISTPSQSSTTLVAPTPSQTSNVPRGATNNQSTSLPNASSNQTPASTSATSTGTTTLSSSNVQITSFTAQVDGSVTVRKSTVTANTNVETEGLIPSAQVVVLRPNQDAKVENSFEVKVNSSEAQLKPLSNTSQDYFKPGKLIGSTKFVVELENGLVFNYTIDVQEGGVVIKPADNQSIQFAESNKQVVIGSGILEAVNALGVSPDNMKTIFLDYKS